ncbi:hypothetical protein B0H11DRAFT_2421300 [Mycena galericulata]|nr:hypothetical protein B0H11DRAFT_2421300 [Mycena galericulata]
MSFSSTNSTASTSSSSTSSSSTARPSISRSKTMPAIRRSLSLPVVDKSIASFRTRISAFRSRRASRASNTKIPPSPSTESIPVFMEPDYQQPSTTFLPRCENNISPLTRPTLKRALTTPAPIRALHSTVLAKIPALTKALREGPPQHKSSVSSVESISSVSATSTRRRRSSSVSSVESFRSTEDKVTLVLRLQALPSTLLGLLTSLMYVVLIMLLPAMAADKPRRKLALKPYQREIVLTDEQERNPPTPPKPTTRLTKAYHRAARRAARARHANTPTEALAVLFAPTPKRVRAVTPMPVDPKMLAGGIPFVVYSSPIALPLPKGPAPTVRPARKARKLTVLPTVKEEETKIDAALCPGW